MAKDWWEAAPVESEGDWWEAAPVELVAEEPPKRGAFSRVIGDIDTAIGQGFKGVPGAITGLIDTTAGLVPYGKQMGLDRPASSVADAAGKLTGFQPEKWAKDDESKYSPEQKAKVSDINDLWLAYENDQATEGDLAEWYATNPGYTGLNVVKSVPSMMLGAAYARVLGAATKLSGLARGAIGEGAVIAGETMKNIDKDVDPQRAAMAATTAGLVGAAVGVVGGKAAQKLGGPDVDTVLAGDAVPKAGLLAGAPLIARAPVAAGLEGAEELIQSGFEQSAQNVAEGKPWSEGVPRASTEGALSGAVMGGGIATISGKSRPSSGQDIPPTVLPAMNVGGSDPSPLPPFAHTRTTFDGIPVSPTPDGRFEDEDGNQYRPDELADIPTINETTAAGVIDEAIEVANAALEPVPQSTAMQDAFAEMRRKKAEEAAIKEVDDARNARGAEPVNEPQPDNAGSGLGVQQLPVQRDGGSTGEPLADSGAGISVADAGADVALGFTPTHTTAIGTPVRAYNDEVGVWEDSNGDIIEDDNAAPIRQPPVEPPATTPVAESAPAIQPPQAYTPQLPTDITGKSGPFKTEQMAKINTKKDGQREALPVQVGENAWVLRQPESTPITPGVKKAKRLSPPFDPAKDSLIVAIAKLGGLSATEAASQGIDPANWKGRGGAQSGVFGKPWVRANGGLTFDGMAEALSQWGYFPEGEGYSANKLLDMIGNELAGNKVYTAQGNEAAAARNYKDQQAAELSREEDAIADELEIIAGFNGAMTQWLEDNADEIRASREFDIESLNDMLNLERTEDQLNDAETAAASASSEVQATGTVTSPADGRDSGSVEAATGQADLLGDNTAEAQAAADAAKAKIEEDAVKADAAKQKAEDEAAKKRNIDSMDFGLSQGDAPGERGNEKAQIKKSAESGMDDIFGQPPAAQPTPTDTTNESIKSVADSVKALADAVGKLNDKIDGKVEAKAEDSQSPEADQAQDKPALFSKAPDYQGEHSPPMSDSGAPLHDLTGGGTVYPDDIYSAQAVQYYGHGDNDLMNRQTISLIRQFKGKPNALVTIYRAIPKIAANVEKIAELEKQMAAYLKRGKTPAGSRLTKSEWYNDAFDRLAELKALPPAVEGKKVTINHGDWVTINRVYAQEHGESALNGDYKIISRKVPANQVFTNGDSIHEYGYDDGSSDTGSPETFFSKGPQAPQGHTVESLTSRITSILERQAKGLSVLVEQGAVVVMNAAQIPQRILGGGLFSKDADDNAVLYSKAANIRAYVDPQTNVVHLIVDQIPADFTDDQILGLLIHELSNHAFEMGKDDAGYESILKQADNMRKMGSVKMREAHQRAKDAKTTPENMTREMLGYFLEANPTHSLSQKLIAWFRAQLRKITASIKGADKFRAIQAVNKWLDTMTEGDLIKMASDALKAAPGKLLTQGAGSQGGAVMASKDGNNNLVEGSAAWAREMYSNRIVPNGWYVHGRVSGETLNTGYVIQLTKRLDVADSYAGETGGVWYVKAKSDAKVLDFTSDDTQDIDDTIEKLQADIDLGRGPDGLVSDVAEDYRDDFSPADIVNSAGAFDDMDIVSWLWDRFEPVMVETPDGAVVIDITGADAVMVPADSNGSVKDSNGDGLPLFSKAPQNPPGTPDLYPEGRFNLPEETSVRKFQRIHHDSLNRWKVVQETIKAQGGDIGLKEDVYRAMERMTSIAADGIGKFTDDVVEPLMKRIADLKTDNEEIGTYLMALGANDRNDYISSIRDDMPDNGSGFTRQEAREIILDYRKRADFKEFDQLARDFQKITDTKLDVLVAGGVITQDHADGMKAAFGFYVPYKGHEIIDESGDRQKGTGAGGGYSTSKTLGKKAYGRVSRAGQVVENIIRDYETAVLLAEKKKIGVTVENLVTANPDSKLWTISTPPKSPGMAEGKKTYEVLNNGVTVGQAKSLREARAIINTQSSWGNNVKADFKIKLNQGANHVTFREAPFDQEGEIRFIRDGKEVRIQMTDKLLVRGYNNLGAGELNFYLKYADSLNRWLRQVYTMKNPGFIFINAIRDVTTSAIVLTGEKGITYAARAMKLAPRSYLSIWHDTRGKPLSALDQSYLDAYKTSGAPTAFAMIEDIEAKSMKLQALIGKHGGISFLQEWQKYGAKSAAKVLLYRTFNNVVFDFIEDVNNGFENMMRLASFRAAIEQVGGLDKVTPEQMDDASRIAKNVTVNFSRKGEHGRDFNALYLFWNANIQGTANIARTVVTAPHRRQVWAMLGALGALGMMAAMMGDDDDDGLTDEWLNQRNLVFTVGQTRIQIPLPYGFSSFVDIGRLLGEVAKGDKKASDASFDMVDSILSNFSPWGSPIADDGFSQELMGVRITPTIFQPLAMSITNTSSFGSKIIPRWDEANDVRPDREIMNRATRGSLFDMAANNPATAWADVSPETIKMLVRTYTGGAGTFFADTAVLPFGMAKSGFDVEKTPLISKFIRVNDIDEYRGRIYNQIADGERALKELNLLKKNRNLAEYSRYQKENGKLISLGRESTNIKKQVKSIRGQEDAARDAGRPVKLHEQRQIALSNRINEKYRAAMGMD